MTVVTRFAPSPTGYLHIGGARTALFNFLYARHMGGKFLLRIEDTDKERSTKEAYDAILEGLEWLKLAYDDKLVLQSENIEKHKNSAEELVKLGKAYYCISTTDEIHELREKTINLGDNFIFQSPWRNKNLEKRPGAVIRIKAERNGFTEVNDLTQGNVKVNNSTLDDMVLLRSDGTPTYMLAVVIDDHNMGVTHVIRGDDHLNNTFRQIQIYKAFGWKIPEYAHIPLIHSPDGNKLSKRYGAVGINYYKEAGYLPETINNYLLRLGWSHGNDEIISIQDAVRWFDIKDVNKGPSRIDFEKMKNLNTHYIKSSADTYLLSLIQIKNFEIANKAISILKNRVKTLVELQEQLDLLSNNNIIYDKDAEASLRNFNIALLDFLFHRLNEIKVWDLELKNVMNKFLEENKIKLSDIGPILRIIMTGVTNALGIYDIMNILGKNETLHRIYKVIKFIRG